MCGIVGFLSIKEFDRFSRQIAEVTNTLSHRGPDDTGTYINASYGIGLAHRRLSIIDLSKAGAQPMHSTDGRYIIVYNGEIYNFNKIRENLIQCGHQFVSNTDTEVVLNAFSEWGVACLHRFIGMFAFAIWDQQSRRLFLARDRLGIKPLYYYFKNQTFLFSSELKALMTFKHFAREVDEEAISLFLHYQYIPSPRTIFKNTYKLVPGSYLIYDSIDLSIKPYWTLPQPSPSTIATQMLDASKVADQLDDLLTQAVGDCLVSDVPLGALLSGGIDSSLVVALMQKVNPTPVRTFSIGFREKGYNEAPWASQIATHLGTDHTELYIDSQKAFDIIPRLPEIYDEPFADSSGIPTFLVSQLTRQHVTVALSGDGGDEQFAGYVRYWITRSLWEGLHRVPISIITLLTKIGSILSPRWMEKCYLPLRDCLPQQLRVTNFQDKWQKVIKLLKQDQLSELYRMTICLWSDSELIHLTGKQLPQSRFEAAFASASQWPALSCLMYVDQDTYLPDCMLTKVDRASMANSLEVRVPLLDHRVVEYTAHIPEYLKYRHGAGKYILKKLLARYIPKELFERPKMGFGVPIDQWLRNTLKPLLLDYLSSERLKREGRFDHQSVEQKIKAHLEGTCNHQHPLWALLMWQMWQERWLT